MSADRDLTALIGSRICHDLISPLGAIGNGVELLSMSGGGGGPEVALISQAVGSANARIRFFRIAYGMAEADQSVAAAEVRSILADMTGGGRLKIDWTAGDGRPRTEVKLCFLVLQCFESAMPWGGQITVGTDAGGWTVTGRADRMKVDPALWAQLDGSEGDVTSAQVHFALVPEAARRAGRTVTTDLSDSEIRVAF